MLCLVATAPSRAEQLFNDGTTAYEQGRYEDALADFQRSDKLHPLPDILYDIAQCHRQLGRWREAEGYYRRYLAAVPHAANREQVAAYLDEVHAQAESAALPPAPAAATSASRPVEVPAPITFPTKLWVTGGLGAGVLVLGGILYGSGRGVAGGDRPFPCDEGICHNLTLGQAGVANGLGYAGESGLGVGAITLVATLIWAIGEAAVHSPRSAP